MSLKIQVLHLRSNKVFYPGDPVSGHVTATGPLNDENTSVNMAFVGRAKVKLKIHNQKVPYSDSHDYFSFQSCLFRGPCKTEEGSSATWPFKLELPVAPAQPKLEVGDGKNAEQNRSPFIPILQKETPLPPTFFIEGDAGMFAMTYCEKYKGSVAYKLLAELHRSKTFARMKRAKGGVPVTLCQTKTQAEEVDGEARVVALRRTFEHTSSRLQAGREEQSRSLRQWTTDSFTKKAPRIYARVSAQAPTLLLQGKAIQIWLGLSIERSRTTAVPPLQFKFVTARFEFKPVTRMSASYAWAHKTADPSDVVFACDLNIEPAETVWTGDDEPITIKRNVLPPKRSIVPSFRAKYIDRSYFAKLTVGLEVGGKRFDEKFRWSPVTLVTKEVETPGEGDEIVAALDEEPSMAVIGTEEGAEWGFEALKGIIEIVGDIVN